jgi:hypothetical protein
MAETKTDEWGTWEKISRYGWRLIAGTETAEFQAKRALGTPLADPRVALRTDVRAAASIADLKAVLEKLLA